MGIETSSSAASVEMDEGKETESTPKENVSLFAPVSLFTVRTSVEPADHLHEGQPDEPSGSDATESGDSPGHSAMKHSALAEAVDSNSNRAPQSGSSEATRAATQESVGSSLEEGPEPTPWSSTRTMRAAQSCSASARDSVEAPIRRDVRGTVLGAAALTATMMVFGHMLFGTSGVGTAKTLPPSDPQAASSLLTSERVVIPTELMSSLKFADSEGAAVTSTASWSSVGPDGYVADGPTGQDVSPFDGNDPVDQGRPVLGSLVEEEEEDGDVSWTETDPREPPAGASDRAVRALAGIPRGQNDRPPIGGVGVSGIHVDRIVAGTGYEHYECTGQADEFALHEDPTISVCFRIVHSRGQPQEVLVSWERDGRVERRISVSVSERRTYRTRVYFRPTDTDVGTWTTRITAPDDTEIAALDFDIVK